MPRIFVAVRTTAAVAAAVRQAQDALRSRVYDVKWVETDNLHLTLRFFGEITEARLEAVSEVVRAVAGETTPFTVELAGVGCFPPRGRPRVIWVGMRAGEAELTGLAARLDGAFGDAGLGREDRPFRPHLTIGRLRGRERRRGQRHSRQRFGPPPPEQAVLAIHQALGTVACGPLSLDVGSILLVESQLRPQGPLYTDRLEVPLGGHAT